ncbi:MAG: tRNA (adenosine(37)-N6)-dimethylallyltransferase MiaA [Chitinispirillaceae bacterium]
MKNCIVVCGPTASGKTSLAVKLASRLKGEILSVDSRQVYRGMDIGTGKDLHEYTADGKNIPCHLIDIADPADIFTLYDYQKSFYSAFRSVRTRNRIPVAAGGSGLYLEAVLKYYRISPVPENVKLRKELMNESRETLESRLFSESREMYEKTDRSTKKRIVRALEIVRSGIKNKELSPEDYPDIRPVILYVVWERPVLRERISSRLAERLQHGMIDEVDRLLTSGISRERFDLFGMEYKHVARYLRGQVGYDQMASELQQDIFHLAKRQDTWFRGMERRGFDVHRVERGDVNQAWAIVSGSGFVENNNLLVD